MSDGLLNYTDIERGAEKNLNSEKLERLRDEFAIAALNAMLQNTDKEGSSRGKNGVKLFAKYAYEYADSMMKAREVQP